MSTSHLRHSRKLDCDLTQAIYYWVRLFLVLLIAAGAEAAAVRTKASSAAAKAAAAAEATPTEASSAAATKATIKGSTRSTLHKGSIGTSHLFCLDTATGICLNRKFNSFPFLKCVKRRTIYRLDLHSLKITGNLWQQKVYIRPCSSIVAAFLRKKAQCRR